MSGDPAAQRFDRGRGRHCRIVERNLSELLPLPTPALLYFFAVYWILAVLVTYRTWTFAISFIQSSTPAAQALICPEARYIAVCWQDGRLDRRHVPASLWQSVEEELARDLTKQPVSRSSAISTVLVGSMGALLVVSFAGAETVTVRRTEDAETTLDNATRAHQPV